MCELVVGPHGSHAACAALDWIRRIHHGYFRELFPNKISALSCFWGWGKIQFYLKSQEFTRR